MAITEYYIYCYQLLQYSSIKFSETLIIYVEH